MGRIAKWLDSTFLPSVNDGRLDYSILPDEVKLASEVFLVTILNDDTSLPAADRWTDSWTAEDVDGHQIVNVYTSFDKALAEYWRLSEAHPDSIMRVERRNLASIISGKSWTAKLIGVYDEECYLCDGKTASRNEVHSLKHPFPKAFNSDGNEMDSIFVHFENASLPMDFVTWGIANCPANIVPKNVLSPMASTDSGIVTLIKLVHSPNALCPMAVTLSGIDTLFRVVHL